MREGLDSIGLIQGDLEKVGLAVVTFRDGSEGMVLILGVERQLAPWE